MSWESKGTPPTNTTPTPAKGAQLCQQLLHEDFQTGNPLLSVPMRLTNTSSSFCRLKKYINTTYSHICRLESTTTATVCEGLIIPYNNPSLITALTTARYIHFNAIKKRNWKKTYILNFSTYLEPRTIHVWHIYLPSKYIEINHM